MSPLEWGLEWEWVRFDALLQRAIIGLRAAGVTQDELARKLGVCPATIVLWHRHGRIPDAHLLEDVAPKLADLTGISKAQWWYSRDVSIEERGPVERVKRPQTDRQRKPAKARTTHIGEQFGRWIVTSHPYYKVMSGRRVRFVNVRCTCPDETPRAINISSLFNGNTVSCGCLRKEQLIRKGKYGTGTQPSGTRKLPELDNDRVRHLYVTKQWAVKHIAREVGHDESTILRRLADMKIPLRPKPLTQYELLDDDVVRDLYEVQKLTQKEVAAALGVQGRPLVRKLKELNIEIRDNGWRARQNPVTHCPQGHEYTRENTRLAHGKYKQCKICDRDRMRASRAAAREHETGDPDDRRDNRS